MSRDTMDMTCLGGTLRRDLDGATWRWSDGTPEPRVEDLALSRLAPNFRCATYGNGTVVEVPRRWRSHGLWPNGVVDDDAAQAIQRLLDEHGREAHRLRRGGYTVPIDAWDLVMGQAIGASWKAEDEPEILDRARALGWDPL